MANRDRYKKLGDLYVTGKTVDFGDGMVIYMRVLNPFEQEEARSAAQAARSRMILALKDTESAERAKFEAKYAMDGHDEVVRTLAESRANLKLPALMNELEDDPEWAEKVEVLRRSEDLTETPTEEEKEYVAQLNVDFWSEVRQRLENEVEYQKRRFGKMTDEQLVEEYHDLWIERRGSDAAMSEHRVTEIWYAARVCEGVKDDDGQWVHENCEGHRLQVFETRADVKDLPEPILMELSDAISEINLTTREGKGSGSPSSSSDSSALPSEQEGSTPSIPTETPTKPLGSSPSPSAMA